jgi:phage protein D
MAYLLVLGGTPVSAAVLRALQEVEVDASLEAASSFRLRLGIAQAESGGWAILDDDLFQPLTPLQVRIQLGSVPKAVINGYVSAQNVVYGDRPGASVLEVTGMDATLLMNLEEKVKSWGSQSDSTIATSILATGSYKLVPRVQTTSPVLTDPEGETIQRGTDIRFLRRLAQRNGFLCYVQPEPTSGLDQGYFGPPTLDGAPQGVVTVAAAGATNVRGFAVRYEMTRPTSATAAGVDARTKQKQSATVAAVAQKALGRTATLNRVTPTPVVQPTGTGLMKTSDLKTMAQSVVDRSAWVLVAEGEVGPGMGLLQPGGIVNVRGAGGLYDGSYLLTRVRHRIGPQGYSQRFEARRNAVQPTGSEVYATS